jgi:undecaprenyl diphosphate synthase
VTEQLVLPDIELKKIPKHIAIIMDGNRRWAKQHSLPTTVGHWKGAEALTNIVEMATNLGVQVLTVYAFSTENWSRDSEEVDSLMHLFKMYLIGQRQRMLEGGVRLNAIGDLKKIPQDVRELLEETKKATARGSKIDLVLAVNYGARDDIRRAVVAVAEDCVRGKIKSEEISEWLFGQYLDTAKWNDPDLLIRTSGEMRLSNFLLWQISYTEVYVTDVMWPDFNDKEFMKALLEFQRRKRRVGV